MNQFVTWVWIWIWLSHEFDFEVEIIAAINHAACVFFSSSAILDKSKTWPTRPSQNVVMPGFVSSQEHQATASHWLGMIWLDNSSSKTVSNSWVACTFSWFTLAKGASSRTWAIIVSQLRTTVKGPPGGSPASSADLFEGFKVPLILTSRPGPWMDIVHVQAIGWCAWWPAATFWHSPVDRNLQIMPQSKYESVSSPQPPPQSQEGHLPKRPQCTSQASTEYIQGRPWPQASSIENLDLAEGSEGRPHLKRHHCQHWTFGCGHFDGREMASEASMQQNYCHQELLIGWQCVHCFWFRGSAWLTFVKCSLALCRLWAGSDFVLNYWVWMFNQNVAVKICHINRCTGLSTATGSKHAGATCATSECVCSTTIWPANINDLLVECHAKRNGHIVTWHLRIVSDSNSVGHAYHLSSSAFKFLKNPFLTLVCPAFCLQLHLSRLQSMADDKHGGWKLWVRHWVWVLKTFLWNWLEFQHES